MKSVYRVLLAGLAASFFAASPLLANETYVCTHDNQQRVITVVYANEGMTVPCEVTYDKGNGAQSLWRAENMQGYCEEQAAAFVEKQRGWGWSCEKQQPAM